MARLMPWDHAAGWLRCITAGTGGSAPIRRIAVQAHASRRRPLLYAPDAAAGEAARRLLLGDEQRIRAYAWSAAGSRRAPVVRERPCAPRHVILARVGAGARHKPLGRSASRPASCIARCTPGLPSRTERPSRPGQVCFAAAPSAPARVYPLPSAALSAAERTHLNHHSAILEPGPHRFGPARRRYRLARAARPPARRRRPRVPFAGKHPRRSSRRCAAPSSPCAWDPSTCVKSSRTSTWATPSAPRWMRCCTRYGWS